MHTSFYSYETFQTKYKKYKYYFQSKIPYIIIGTEIKKEFCRQLGKKYINIHKIYDS